MNYIFLKKMISDKLYLQLMHIYHTGKFINFKNPTTYTEKQQWLKIYNRKSEYTTMADKFLVRKYISEVIGVEYLIPLVGGPWNSVEEIEVDKLPNEFVLKCSNGHGVEICKDKNNFDFDRAKKVLKKSMKENLFWYGREWPYKNSESKIIAEELLLGEVTDYKFYCFNGKVKYIQVITDRNNEKGPFGDYYDINKKYINVRGKFMPNNPNRKPELPNSFEEMVFIAEKLSKGIPFVRIDLYEKNNKPLFGEITFFHASGFCTFNDKNFEKKLGDLIDLNLV